ncbi:MAG: three-Cys-motif partner protein TcmP [Ignavibacteriales bacterium]|nr:three-Cys-motif partner protein TcmP [Ignavibacteriales bacterium]
MEKLDPKKVMLEHSKAKVELYGRYLSTFLNIISRDKHTEKIYLYDLFCGEGMYDNGEKGSPIVALEVIKNHYFENNNSCPRIKVLFNDVDEIKIKKLKEHCSKIFQPNNSEIVFESKNYSDLIEIAIREITQLSIDEKAIIFIDPYGYKDIRILQIEKLLKGNHSEVLLFLPISQMYRYANVAMRKEITGTEYLVELITEIFQSNIPRFDSPEDFINKIKESLKVTLKNFFVDTFRLQRDPQNVYSLFFFTSHIRGFEKMLEAKWKIDSEQGKGFRLEKTGDLFSSVVHSNYPSLLESLLRSDYRISNRDIYEFGLRNGYLPTHTIQVFRWWQSEKKMEVEDDNGLKVRNGWFYLDYKYHSPRWEKKVYFKLIA